MEEDQTQGENVVTSVAESAEGQAGLGALQMRIPVSKRGLWLRTQSKDGEVPGYSRKSVPIGRVWQVHSET